MNKKELVSAYFDGGMTEAESQDFLNKVSQDVELKKEFEFQTDIIEGLKAARVSELKTRLDNVSIGGGAISFGKLAITGGVLIIAGLSYYALNNTDVDNTFSDPKIVEDAYNELIATNALETEDISSIEKLEEPIETEANSLKKNINTNKSDEVKAPSINKPEGMEPLELVENDNENNSMPESGLVQKSAPVLSAIDVDIDNSKRKYSFHYQLKEGKLFLYGSFDNGLYEILEFNSPDGKILYLYYKDKYYGLSKNQADIVPLDEITENTLISKLEAARKEVRE